MRLVALVVAVVSSGAFAQAAPGETRDPNANSALKPEAGGPSTIGDPVRVTDLSVSHSESDLTIHTALGDFSLERSFSSSNTWKNSMILSSWFGYDTTLPGDLGPDGGVAVPGVNNIFQGTQYWWSSLSAYAEEYLWAVGQVTGSPNGGRSVDIRDTSGDLYNSGNMLDVYTTPPNVMPATTTSARIIRTAAPNQFSTDLILVKPGAGKTEFEFVQTGTRNYNPVVGNMPGTHSYALYRLKAIYPDYYAMTATPASVADLGQPICTFEYPNATSWKMTAIHCVGGIDLTVTWSMTNPSHVVSVSDSASGSPLVVYTYDSNNVLSRADNYSSRTSKTYSPYSSAARTTFNVDRGALGAAEVLRVTSKTITNAPVCGSQQFYSTSSENNLVGSYVYSPAYGGQSTCPNGVDISNTATEATPSGDSVTRVITRDSAYGFVTKIQESCAACSSVRSTVRTWSPNGTLPTPTDTCKMDSQGVYTTTSARAVCGPSDPSCSSVFSFRDTEVNSRSYGATDCNGTGALRTVNATYNYLNNMHHLQDQVVSTVSMTSVLSPPAATTVSWVYDENKRPVSVIRSGFTASVAGVTSLKYIGTFYFNNNACSGGAADPLDRVVEVHGPCWVAGPGSTDCDVAGSPVPLARFSYYPWGTNGGRVATKQVAADYTGGSCAAVNWLTTTYNTYDTLGHVTLETDPNGTTTSRSYTGDLLTSETVAASGISAQTLSFFHPSQGGEMSSRRLPSGVWERYCYRVSVKESPVAADCLSGGVLTSRLQWVARVGATGVVEPAGSIAIVEKTTSTYVGGTGVLGSGNGVLAKQDSQSFVTAEHAVSSLGYDALGRVVANRAQTTGGLTLYQANKLYDEEGRLIADGSAFSQSSALCNGFSSGWPTGDGRCTSLWYDRAGRLQNKYGPDGVNYGFGYDTQGHLTTVNRGSGTTNVVTYQFDDFGNPVTVTGEWMSGSRRQAFDAAGHLQSRVDPGSSTIIAYNFDGLGRLTSELAGITLFTSLYSMFYDGAATPPAGCTNSGVNTKGRLLLKADSFGSSWYEYNGLGQVTAIRRVRGGTGNCSAVGSTDSSDATPDSRYVYSADGRLTAMKYPHGRWLSYTYGLPGSGQEDRVVAISTGLTQASATAPLLSGISYGLGGAIAGYNLATSVPVSVAYTRAGTETIGATCATGSPALDGSGRFSRISVTRGGANVFSRRFAWSADQLAAEMTCVLADVNPRTITYGEDLGLKVTSAGRFAVNEVGGQLASRTYSYGGGTTPASLRSFGGVESATEAFRYDTGNRLTSVEPWVSTSNSAWNSWASTQLTYDAVGRVSTLVDSRLPVTFTSSGGKNGGLVAVAHQGRLLQFTPDTAFSGVYKSVNVNGSVYQYIYDAVGRRRLKVYPSGKSDEFFYDGNNLIEDRGQTTLGTGTDLTLDEYVWLNGAAVVQISTRLDASFNRLASAACDRNDDSRPCGTAYIVNDYLPKPVAMIDSAGYLAGIGEYDPFGRVNEYTKRGDSPYSVANFPNVLNATYTPSVSWSLLGSYSQPWTGNQRVRARVKYSQINANGVANAPGGITDKTWVTTTAATVAPTTGGYYTGQLYATTTNWFDVPADGLVNVNWSSDAVADPAQYSGATAKGLEYRRYEYPSTPRWVPFRFPGQYADTETDLFENWNRYYNPSTGEYLAPDGILPSLERAFAGTLEGPYGYAVANPLIVSDRLGQEGGTADGPGSLVAAWSAIMDSGGSTWASLEGAATSNLALARGFAASAASAISEAPLAVVVTVLLPGNVGQRCECGGCGNTCGSTVPDSPSTVPTTPYPVTTPTTVTPGPVVPTDLLSQGKGERGQTAKPDGTGNPYKKMRPDPKDPTKVIYKHPHTGKDVSKPKPPGFDEYWNSKGR